MANPTAVIAHDVFWEQRHGEAAFQIHVEIGTSHALEDDPNCWACPVAVRPLYSRLSNAHGGSSLQALCLASALALDLLQDFKDGGGTLSYSPGEEVPLNAYAFGVVTRSGTP